MIVLLELAAPTSLYMDKYREIDVWTLTFLVIIGLITLQPIVWDINKLMIQIIKVSFFIRCIIKNKTALYPNQVGKNIIISIKATSLNIVIQSTHTVATDINTIHIKILKEDIVYLQMDNFVI